MNEENKQLCPKCKTGLESVAVDPKSPVCPYIGCHNGSICAKFVPLENKTDIKNI